MRWLAWIVVGATVLLSAGIGLRDWPALVGAGPGAPATEGGGRIEGTVTRVRDGDTIELAEVAVRIANLDCAKRDSQAGQRASERMSELTRDREVACQLEGRRFHDEPCHLMAGLNT